MNRTRRAAFTTVELLVAVSLLGLMITMFWTVWSGGSRETRQVEQGSALMTSATLLQEFLTWDLERCVALGLAPEDLAGMDGPSPELELPVYAGYDGDSVNALQFRLLAYTFDEATGVLYRDEKPVVQEGLARVSFRWTETLPTMLEVELEGAGSFGQGGGTFRIRLPAPRGTDSLAAFRFARHHRAGDHVLVADEAGGPVD